MPEDQYIPSSSSDKAKIRDLMGQLSRIGDFMEWLFDDENTEGVDWMSQSEAWQMFEEWEEKQEL